LLPRFPQHQRAFVDQLPALYEKFELVSLAKDIPAVQEYKNKMKERSSPQQRTISEQPQDECCIIL